MGEIILLTEKAGFICNHLQHVYKYLVYSLLCVADSVSICNHLQPFATVINTDPQRVLRAYVADVANVADKMQKITLGVYIHTERNQFQILYVYL